MKYSSIFLVALVLFIGTAEVITAKYYCLGLEDKGDNGLNNCLLFNYNNISIGSLCVSPTIDDYVTEDLTITVDREWDLYEVKMWYGFNIKHSPLDKEGLPIVSAYKQRCAPSGEDTSSCTIPISIIEMFKGDALAESRKLPCDRAIAIAAQITAANQNTNQLAEVWIAGSPFVSSSPDITYNNLFIRCGDEC